MLDVFMWQDNYQEYITSLEENVVTETKHRLISSLMCRSG
jgi:hypothetical protein